MRLCGWETRELLDRYNIIDERDLARAVARRYDNSKQAMDAEAAEETARS